MTVFKRGAVWGVKVWDSETKRYRWIGTFPDEQSARMAEQAAKRWEPIPSKLRVRPKLTEEFPIHVEGPGVYFMVCEKPPRVKIGYSQDLVGRLGRLLCGSPVPLKLEGYIEGPPELERLFHERFKTYRLHGEWFRIDGELKSFMANVRGDMSYKRLVEPQERRLAEYAGKEFRRPGDDRPEDEDGPIDELFAQADLEPWVAA